MGLAVHKLTLIPVAIRVPLHAPTIPHVSVPLALVDSSLAVLHHSEPKSLSILQLSSINSLTVLFQAEVTRLSQKFEIENSTLHLILFFLARYLPLVYVHGLVLFSEVFCFLLLGYEQPQRGLVKVRGVSKAPTHLLYLSDVIFTLNCILLLQGIAQLHRNVMGLLGQAQILGFARDGAWSSIRLATSIFIFGQRPLLNNLRHCLVLICHWLRWQKSCLGLYG